MTASDHRSSRKKLLQVGGHPHMRRPWAWNAGLGGPRVESGYLITYSLILLILRRCPPLANCSAFGSVLDAMPLAHVRARGHPNRLGSFVGRYEIRLIPNSNDKFRHSEIPK